MQLRCSRRIWIVGMFGAFGASCAPPRPPVPVPASAPRKGPAGARFVLQEIGDYECPFCADVQPDVKQLMAVHAGEIALVWRNYPLRMHPHAALAAEAAMEVKAQLGDDGFWHYHDTLFTNQGALEEADLERYASALGGVDIPRFVSALRERKHLAEVEADRRAIEDLRIDGMATPSFLFAGDVLVGSYPYDSFLGWIEDRM